MSAGLLAALQVVPVLALGYQVGVALVIFAWAMSRVGAEPPHAAILVSLGAVSLLFGAMAVMNGSLGAAMLFFAAFLLLADPRLTSSGRRAKRRRGRSCS